MKTKSGNNEATLIELSFYFRLWTLPRNYFFESFVTMHLTLATGSVSVERPFPGKRFEKRRTIDSECTNDKENKYKM